MNKRFCLICSAVIGKTSMDKRKSEWHGRFLSKENNSVSSRNILSRLIDDDDVSFYVDHMLRFSSRR